MPRILVVDDDKAMRGIIKDHLSPIYEVVDAGTPETARSLAIEHRPAAILLDLSMPGSSGFELCRALSSLTFTQHIPIFIVSGENEKNRTFCQNLGAVAYFEKPIDFTKLKMHLAEVVRPERTERRVDVRVQLIVNLKLKGKDRQGAYFEVRAATENVSKGGFLCACAASLEDATTVEVSVCGEHVLYLGFARLVRVVKRDLVGPRYGFQFIGTTGAKILG
jgi:chemotaxis family two-component system response regulator PixH